MDFLHFWFFNFCVTFAIGYKTSFCILIRFKGWLELWGFTVPGLPTRGWIDDCGFLNRVIIVIMIRISSLGALMKWAFCHFTTGFGEDRVVIREVGVKAWWFRIWFKITWVVIVGFWELNVGFYDVALWCWLDRGRDEVSGVWRFGVVDCGWVSRNGFFLGIVERGCSWVLLQNMSGTRIVRVH